MTKHIFFHINLRALVESSNALLTKCELRTVLDTRTGKATEELIHRRGNVQKNKADCLGKHLTTLQTD